MFSLAVFFCLAACSTILTGLPDEGGKSLVIMRLSGRLGDGRLGDVRAERAWHGTARFPELVRSGRKPIPVIGIVHAGAITHPHSPCRKLCSSARSGSLRGS